MKIDNRAKNIDFIRNSNLKLLASLKIIKTDIVLLKELSDFEKNEINAVENANESGNNSILSSVKHFSPEVDLSKNSDEEKLFQSISTYEKTVIPNLDELIKIFDDESRVLNSYFNKTDSDTFQYSSQLISIIVQNGEKIKAIVDYLVGFIPAFSKLELELVGYADKIDDVLIDEYYRFYNKLYSSILDKTSNTFSLMINLEIILSFLNGIMGTKKDLIGDFETEFITFLEKSKDKNKEDGITFASNSLKHETMSNILPSLSTFIKDFGNENGGFNELHNTIKDDDMKKVKAYLNSVLKNLFSGIGKDLDKQIDKIVPKKKSNFDNDFKKPFIDNWNLVSNKIQEEKYIFSSNKNRLVESLDNLIYTFTNEEGNSINLSFSDFKKKYLKDNSKYYDIINESIRILSNYGTNKKILSTFLETQEGIEKLKSKNDDSSDNWFSGADKIKDLSSVISGLNSILNNLLNSDDETYEEIFIDSKSSILDSLKVIALYLNKNKESYSNVDLTISEIKIYYSNFNGNINDLSQLKRFIESLLSFIETIR